VIVNRHRLRLALVLLVGVWAVSIAVTPRPSNPPVRPGEDVGSDLPLPDEVRNLLRNSCFDCHSNETRWPWYATVFPASWLVKRDVSAARGQMNFSEWMGYNVFDRADMLDDICGEARDRTMPLRSYLWLHPAAALRDTQIESLCAWTSREADRLMGAME
jgi:hypothetical protein